MLVQCLWAGPPSLHTVTPLSVLALGEGQKVKFSVWCPDPHHLVAGLCSILSSKFGGHTSFHVRAAPPAQFLFSKVLSQQKLFRLIAARGCGLVSGSGHLLVEGVCGV